MEDHSVEKRLLKSGENRRSREAGMWTSGDGVICPILAAHERRKWGRATQCFNRGDSAAP
jgi:hypothetical protein